MSNDQRELWGDPLSQPEQPFDDFDTQQQVEEVYPEDEHEDNMTDVEADADTLASAGWGTDEDYGHFGYDDCPF